MRRLIVLAILSTLIFVMYACGEKVQGAKEESKPYAVRKLDNNIYSGFIVDERTNCLYNNNAPVIGSDGEVVGCRNGDGMSVDEYFNDK